MEYCGRCKERWFEMKLKEDVCNKCFLADRKKNEDDPFLYSAANNMDPGCIPSHLPELGFPEDEVSTQIPTARRTKRARNSILGLSVIRTFDSDLLVPSLFISLFDSIFTRRSGLAFRN
jgi:hypothetical protein